MLFVLRLMKTMKNQELAAFYPIRATSSLEPNGRQAYPPAFRGIDYLRKPSCAISAR